VLALVPLAGLLLVAGEVDLNATVVAETRGGQAPLRADQGPTAGAVAVLTPAAELAVTRSDLDFRLEYSPRIFWRQPNEVQRLRPLVLHVGNLTLTTRLTSRTALTAGASVAGIEETAVRALVKLEQVLPAQLRRRVGALGSATSTLPVGGPTVDPQHLTVIATACRDSECLRFAYRRRDGTDSRREVEPHSVVNRGRRWYLVAWDRRREDWRTFRIDRLARPASTGVRFQARRLPAKDAAAYVERSIAAAPTQFEAVVTLKAPADEITARVLADERTASVICWTGVRSSRIQNPRP